MIWTITLILLALVGINFLLLFFSCNKTTKKESVRKPKVLKEPTTKQSASSRLAATGS